MTKRIQNPPCRKHPRERQIAHSARFCLLNTRLATAHDRQPRRASGYSSRSIVCEALSRHVEFTGTSLEDLLGSGVVEHQEGKPELAVSGALRIQGTSQRKVVLQSTELIFGSTPRRYSGQRSRSCSAPFAGPPVGFDLCALPRPRRMVPLVRLYSHASRRWRTGPVGQGWRFSMVPVERPSNLGLASANGDMPHRKRSNSNNCRAERRHFLMTLHSIHLPRVSHGVGELVEGGCPFSVRVASGCLV